MIDKVRAAISYYNMISPGDFVVTGVSGGPDSVALLCCLHELAAEMQFELHVVHVNHGLRPEAEEEAEFVLSLASKLGISAVLKRIDSKRLNEGSLQELARLERRKIFLEECADKSGAKIALGHNANDQAETVLHRLLRGGGTGGLGGIHPVRENFIRPLLFVFREEIEEYLKYRNIPFRNDRSNFKPVYLRNKIRLELIPLLRKEFNPKVMEGLSKAAVILREDDAYLNQEAAKILESSVERIGDGYFVPEKVFNSPFPLITRIVRQIFSVLAHEPRGVEFDHVKRALSFAKTGRSGSFLELPKFVRVYKEQSGIFFCSGESALQLIAEAELVIGGETRINEAGLVIVTRVLENLPGLILPEGAWNILLDYGEINCPLMIRGRRQGDKILQQNAYHKLKEIFSERKIPIRLRDKYVLLTQDDEVIWIPGVLRSDKLRVTERTTTVLELAATKFLHPTSLL